MLNIKITLPEGGAEKPSLCSGLGSTWHFQVVLWKDLGESPKVAWGVHSPCYTVFHGCIALRELGVKKKRHVHSLTHSIPDCSDEMFWLIRHLLNQIFCFVPVQISVLVVVSCTWPCVYSSSLLHFLHQTFLLVKRKRASQECHLEISTYLKSHYTHTQEKWLTVFSLFARLLGEVQQKSFQNFPELQELRDLHCADLLCWLNVRINKDAHPHFIISL